MQPARREATNDYSALFVALIGNSFQLVHSPLVQFNHFLLLRHFTLLSAAVHFTCALISLQAAGVCVCPACAQLMQKLTYGRPTSMDKLVQLYACSAALTSFCQRSLISLPQEQQNTTQNLAAQQLSHSDGCSSCLHPTSAWFFVFPETYDHILR